MTRPKSERRCFGALLGRVFHVHFNLSKGMLIDTPNFQNIADSDLIHEAIWFVRYDIDATFSAFHVADIAADSLLCRVKATSK